MGEQRGGENRRVGVGRRVKKNLMAREYKHRILEKTPVCRGVGGTYHWVP